MALRSVKRSTLAEQVAAQLERMITGGEWTPGSAIPSETLLCERLGVSRNTLREAIRALTLLGVLEARPGAGTFVRSTSVLKASFARRLTGCSLAETLEARDCIERSAARLAAERRTDEDARELRAGADAIDRALAAGETTDVLTELAFVQDQRLVAISRNPILIELFESIAEPVRAAIRTAIEKLRYNEEVAAEGCRLVRQLVDEIEAGDAQASANVIADKTRLVQRWLLEDKAPPDTREEQS